jgi:hypothetical protein
MKTSGSRMKNNKQNDLLRITALPLSMTHPITMIKIFKIKKTPNKKIKNKCFLK